jgi:hypothetical protein
MMEQKKSRGILGSRALIGIVSLDCPLAPLLPTSMDEGGNHERGG